MIMVDSSMVKSIGYDGDNRMLFMRFNNDTLFRYKNVPYSEYDRLINAVSVGTYFNSKIKNVYEYDRLDDRGV